MQSICARMVGAFLLVALWAGVGQAQELSLYEGEVPVASQSEADRLAALPAALDQVLRKLGDTSGAGDANPANLLQQYRYRQEMVNVDGQMQPRVYLIARFDKNALQSRMTGSAATAWATQRPEPILWLAIDDGSGARIVSQNAASAVAPLTARATQHGVRVRLPRYDAKDQTVLGVQDVVGGSAYALDAATQHYGGPALIGWMRRDDSQWVVDWQVRDGEAEIGRWRTADTQAAVVLAGGADGAVDVLRERYSGQALSGPAGRYAVRVEGLGSGADFARVMGLLNHQPIMRNITLLSADGTTLELELDMSSDVNSLVHLLRGSRLEAAEVGGADRQSVLVLRRR